MDATYTGVSEMEPDIPMIDYNLANKVYTYNNDD